MDGGVLRGEGGWLSERKEERRYVVLDLEDRSKGAYLPLAYTSRPVGCRNPLLYMRFIMTQETSEAEKTTNNNNSSHRGNERTPYRM